MSIRSMTAYASGERNTPWGTLGCELRAVNHRFLELGARLPDELRALEPALRERVSTRVSRGKLDLTVRLRASEGAVSLQVDEALVERAIRNSSKSRDIVLDPFGGSGSTLIACEKSGRQARLVELDPRYCDVIVQRWQDWAGGTAVLDRDGRSFERSPAR